MSIDQIRQAKPAPKYLDEHLPAAAESGAQQS
jgi:hypothetical protein